MSCQLLISTWLRYIPPGAFQADAFYLKPLKKPADESKSWYSLQPLGRNTLAAMMKKMSNEAGLLGNITNHSLRAFGANVMFQKGVPESLI